MISIRQGSKPFGKNSAIDDFSLEINHSDLTNYLNPDS